MPEIEETSDKTPLLSREGDDDDEGKESLEMKKRKGFTWGTPLYDYEKDKDARITSTSKEQETAFIAKDYVYQRERGKEEASERVKYAFRKVDTSKFLLKLNIHDQVIVKGELRAKTDLFLNKS